MFKEKILINTNKIGLVLFPNLDENDILFGIAITMNLPGTLLQIGLGFITLYIAIGEDEEEWEIN